MPDGSSYEIFVHSLQQALLDAESFGEQKNIKIELNKKIVDNCGVAREFDLYWEYELAGVTYKTVIECKDYSSRVSVEKIDALIGKIRDIPDLRPLFATKTGYQSGAEAKAKTNKMDLLIVREQNDEDWKDKAGNPCLRVLNIQTHSVIPARIISFNPKFDRKWVTENTSIDPDRPDKISGANNEIFVDDVAGKENYSLHELANRLTIQGANEYGETEKTESFEEAYLVYGDTRLKMSGYTVRYVRSKPMVSSIVIDFTKELVGVIEYLNKGSSTAVFKDKVVKNWR